MGSVARKIQVLTKYNPLGLMNWVGNLIHWCFHGNNLKIKSLFAEPEEQIVAEGISEAGL